MTFGQNQLNTNRLSADDKKKIAFLLMEAKSRGIPLPENFEVPTSRIDTSWGMGENGYFVKNDGTLFNPRDELEDFIKDSSRFILLKSGRGGGKALDIDTPIMTTDGWKTMNSIVVGDFVFDDKGLPTQVTFISDVMYGNSCYRVEFIDGSFVVADGEHLWTVLTENGRSQKNRGGKNNYYKTLTTGEMVDNYVREYRTPVYNYSVDVCEPIQHFYKELSIHPYVLGAWLGDGNSRDPVITIGLDDREMVDIIESFGYPLHNLSDEYAWSFTNKSKVGEFLGNLKSLDVYKNKHIPFDYLQSSVEQRTLLLMGLMDTDGTISQRGHCSFDNKNMELALDVKELVASLGMKASIHRYEILDYDTPTWSYKVSFTPSQYVFMLTRKRNRQDGCNYNPKRNSRRVITSIAPVESVPVRCIEVESESHLYLVTDSFIPTHNTTSGTQKALLKVKQGLSGAIMNPDFENFSKSTWPELQAWIPWNMVVPKHRHRQRLDWEPVRPFSLVFINGAKIYCKGLKDPESARGSNVNWFWYDEGRRDHTGLGWKNAIAFCRVGNMPQAWCTTTMAETDHWTNTFFNGDATDELKKIIDDVKKTGTDQNLFAIYKTSTKENAENLDPMFYASLVSAYPSGYLRAREIDGEAADEGGSLGDRRWFDNKGLLAEPEWVTKKVRFWDLAGTEKKILKGKKMNDPDESVGSLVGTDSEKDLTKKKYCIIDQFGGHWAWAKLKEMVLETTKNDGESVYVCFEQEPASGGKNQVAELKEFLKKELPWVQFMKGRKSTDIDGAWNPKDAGDRVMGANTWFAEAQTTEANGQIHEGQWYYVKGLYSEKFFTQLDTFDGEKHDDRITSITGARHVLAPIHKKWSSMKFLALTGKTDK